MLIGQLLLQIVLILLNALFAATEIAVVSLDKARIKVQAEEGNAKAKKLMELLDQPTRFLSTTQIGITLAGFFASAFAAENFSQKLTDWAVAVFHISERFVAVLDVVAVIVVTILLSAVMLVFGELVPKRLAIKYKEPFSFWVCPFVLFLSRVFSPLIACLTAATNVILRLFGIDPNEKEAPVSEEDIIVMVNAGVSEGTVKKSGSEYIKNIFRMDDLTAQQVMTPRHSVTFISPDATDAQIVELIDREAFSRVPVYDDRSEMVVGILNTAEYLINRTHSGFEPKDAVYDPITVPETATIDDILVGMQKQHNHMVIVVDEYGLTVGVVTMEDILEEVVGEIWDERDEVVKPIVAIDGRSYRVSCSMNIDEFFEYFKRFDVKKAPSIQATTVNGWLESLCNAVPKVKQEFRCEPFCFTVTKADDRMAYEAIVTIQK